MKKILIKIIFLVLFCGIFAVVNSYASDSFKVSFGDSIEIDAGESVEVPLTIENISLEGQEKILLGFQCKIEYDEDLFEIEYVSANGLNDYYNDETHQYVCNVVNANASLTNITDVAIFKLTAKENIESGVYYITFSNLEAGNDEKTVVEDTYVTSVYVNGIESEETEEEEDSISNVGNIEELSSVYKELIAEITVNDEGTKVTIVPDEVNGAEVSSVVVDGNTLTRNDGKYVFATEPNEVYMIYFYGSSGAFLGSRYVLTVVDEDYTGDITNPTKEDTEDGKSEDGQEENNEENKEDNTKDENKSNNEQESKNDTKEDSTKQSVNKSAQTGDNIIVAIATLIMATAILTALLGIKLRKENM